MEKDTGDERRKSDKKRESNCRNEKEKEQQMSEGISKGVRIGRDKGTRREL